MISPDILLDNQKERPNFIGQHVLAFVEQTFVPSKWQRTDDYEQLAEELKGLFYRVESVDEILQAGTQFMLDTIKRPERSLDERDLALLENRFGLRDHPRSLEETARPFGISRERVRQINARQMAMLRHPLRLSKTVEFLGSLL